MTIESTEHQEGTNPPLLIASVSGSCSCMDCKKQFEPYQFNEDCWTCEGEGEVEKEMEWEYEASMYRCYTCKGTGYVEYEEKSRCKNCKERYLYDDDEEECEENVCSGCGRSCNCH